MKLSYRRLTLALALLAALICVGLAAAQDTTLRLSLRKQMGFSSGQQIQGQFSLGVSGAPQLASVTYRLDERELGTVTAAPFSLSFSTGGLPLGAHTLSARGIGVDGASLQSNTIKVQIVTPGEAAQATQRIVIPLVAVILVLMAAGTGGSAWLTARNQRRRSLGQAPIYGPAGGAICPHCSQPFALSLFNLNLGWRKLARCPTCGKWSSVTRSRPEQLAAAQATLEEGSRPTVQPLSEEEQLRRAVEATCYQ